MGFLWCLHGSRRRGIPGLRGWHLCDGTSGTPDLRDRFLIGAGDSFAPGATGGATTHTHTFTGDGHTHLVQAGSDIQSGAQWAVSMTTDQATGTTDPGSSMPTYYALAYIMKL